MAEYDEIVEQFERMCEHYENCDGCPLRPIGKVSEEKDRSVCMEWSFKSPSVFQYKVMKWAEEHPEEENMARKMRDMTDADVAMEIKRLNNSEAVRLARKEHQYMYQLRWLEKRGKELMSQGITEDSFRCAYDEEQEG